MRGTGYAIGEILIFLAIAAIIGFLIGWLVFYRRPGQAGSALSPVNPNHVKRLEERSRTVDDKLVRIEKRAAALLETLAKTPTRGAAGAAVAAAPEPVDVPPSASGPAVEEKAEAGTEKIEQAKIKVETGEQKATDITEEAKDKVETGEQKATDITEEAKDTAEETEVDGYLSEADERISKLEETLDKLSEKLAELGDD
jgi:hypothetical protein